MSLLRLIDDLKLPDGVSFDAKTTTFSVRIDKFLPPYFDLTVKAVNFIPGGLAVHLGDRRAIYPSREDLLACIVRLLLSQREREQRRAGGDGDVLPAVDRVAHRAAVDLAAERDLPEQRSVAGVEREEVAFRAAAEHDIAAVERTPAQVMSFILNSHFWSSVLGSNARTTP